MTVTKRIGSTTYWQAKAVSNQQTYLSWAYLKWTFLAWALFVFSAPLTVRSDDFEERPAQLKRTRTEAQEDVVKASALFADARLKFQRRDYVGALAGYQRAHRYSPQTAAIVHEIVPLATSLQRKEEATRYAAIGVRMPIKDAPTAAQLGVILSQNEKWKEAILAYERLIALQDNRTSFASLTVHLELARLCFLEKDYAKSVKSFKPVTQALKDPATLDLTRGQLVRLKRAVAQSYPVIAEALLQTNDLEQAEELFRKADEDRANAPGLALNLARIRFRQNRPGDARRLLAKYIKSRATTGGISAYELLEKIVDKEVKGDTERLAKLAGELAAYLKDDTSNIPLAYFLAELWLRHKKPKEAVDVLNALAKRAPSRDVFTKLLNAQLDLKNVDGVLQTLQMVLAATGSFAGLEDAVVQRLAQEKALSKTIEDKVVASSTKEFALPFAMGLLKTKQESFDEAAKWFEKAAKVANPTERERLYRTWGIELYVANRSKEAAKVNQRAIDDDEIKRKQIHYYLLAGALMLGKDPNRAVAAAKSAVKADATNPRMHSRLAWIQFQAKQMKDARSRFEKIIKDFGNLQDESVREVIRDARMGLSNIATLEKQIDEATEWLERVLDENPNDIGALNDLGYLWADHDMHLERALRMTQRAVKAKPNNGAYRDSLGWAHYKLGQYEKALEQLKKAVELEEEPDGVILDHLGDALNKTGKSAEAQKMWKKAVEQLSSDDDKDLRKRVQTKLEKQQPNKSK